METATMNDCCNQTTPAYWPERMAKVITDNVEKQVKEMLSGTRLVRNNKHHIQLLQPQLDFMRIGEVVGSGSFSQVSPVTLRDGRKYALKALKQSLTQNPEEFSLAAAELAYEAHIMSSLDHPNILKIRGWSLNGISCLESGQHDSFFLCLDMLDETLHQRIERWRDVHEDEEFNTMMSTSIAPPQQQPHELQEQQTLYLQKIRIMNQIASALEYMHSMGIIYRDLKPNNIGFIGDTVQIFDFGLSRELPALDTSVPFAMSGKVGTLRYMAPEVARHEGYNVSADVYSFAMVSYELLSLEKPFDGWTRQQHADLVCRRGIRPETSSTAHPIPGDMKLLLEQAWNSNPSCRGTMFHVKAQIEYLESQQVKLMAEQQQWMQQEQQLQQQLQLQREQQYHQQQQLQQFQQQQQQQQVSPMFPPAPPVASPSNNDFYVDMSYCMAPSPPPPTRKLFRSRRSNNNDNNHNTHCNMDDSIGTIGTGSLSADSESYF
ncbi:MAG: hypothetical protein SGILL_001135 [Bacillariaceae sp.]